MIDLLSWLKILLRKQGFGIILNLQVMFFFYIAITFESGLLLSFNFAIRSWNMKESKVILFILFLFSEYFPLVSTLYRKILFLNMFYIPVFLSPYPIYY